MSGQSSKDVVIAMDIGGTGMKCALVDADRRVLLARRYPTGPERGPEAVVRTILATASELAQAASAEGWRAGAAGVAVPGMLDETTGVIRWAGNLGFHDVPLRDLVATHLGLPAALGHDVRAGAMAEARLGAGREVRRMLFMAIGTGIASGFALDGRIDPGAHGAAGEIGHVRVRTEADAPLCRCGQTGCLEMLASATAVAAAYAAADPTAGVVTAKDVAARVAAGERLAQSVWQDAIVALADGLLTCIALYDPELIVLGGGLAESEQLLLGPLRAALDRRHTFHTLPRLALAALGDEAGCLGAAMLALDLMEARV